MVKVVLVLAVVEALLGITVVMKVVFVIMESSLLIIVPREDTVIEVNVL